MHIPSGYAQITWRGVNTFSGQVFNTSVGCTIADFDPGDLDELDLTFWDEGSFGGLTWEGWTSLGVLLKVGTADPSEPVTLESLGGHAGLGTGNPSAPNLAVLIKKLTARGGRRGRGRMFIPGPQELWVNGTGALEPDGFSAYAEALTTWQAAVVDVAGIGDLVLLHTDAGDGSPNAITGMIVEGQCATQRRRMR